MSKWTVKALELVSSPLIFLLLKETYMNNL